MKITLEQFNACDDIVKRRILSDLQSNASARRERAALQVLPAIISSRMSGYFQPKTMAENAIQCADALLEELDKS